MSGQQRIEQYLAELERRWFWRACLSFAAGMVVGGLLVGWWT